MHTSPELSAWQQVGIWRGGTVTGVLYAGERLFAASRAGLLFTDDDGVSWQRSGAALRDPAVVTLAGTDDGTHLFFASESERLYHSTNCGLQWTEVEAWAGLGLITAIALSPNYAQDSTIFVATPDGPYRSQDGGASWESATFGLIDMEVLCIAVDPRFAETETLWIGTANGGLYKSRNGGRSWRDAGSGIPDEAVQALLAIANEDSTLLLAGVEFEGIFRSVDGGTSWRQAQRGMDVNCMAVRANGVVLAGSDAGMLVSKDGGVNWSPANAGDFLAMGLAFSTSGKAAAAIFQTGVALSADAGASWHPTTTIPAIHVPPLAVRTNGGALSLADADGGWVVSNNQGVTWTQADIEAPVIALAAPVGTDFILAGSDDLLYRIDGNELDALELPCPVTHMALSPTFADDGVMLIAGVDEHDSDTPLLFRSDDGGELWRQLSPPWSDRTLLGCQFSPRYAKDQSIYAITALPQETTYSVEIWQSADRGLTWIDLAAFATPAPIAPFLVLDDVERSIFIANGERVFHIYTKTDSGELAVAQEMLPGEERVIHFAVAPDGVLYAATSHGVWQREGMWRPVGSGLEDEIVVAVLPGAQDLLTITLGGEIWQRK